LGERIFAYFPDKEHFDRDLALCDRAMQLAQELKAPALIEETRVIRGLVQMLKELYLLAEAAAQGKKMTLADQERAAAALALMDEGSRAVHDGVLAWGAMVAPEIAAHPPTRFSDTVNCAEDVVSQASDIVTNFGVKDPNRPYRTRKIGGWTTDDFKTGQSQKKTWEVTSSVSGPGRYTVFFFYDKGWYGAHIKRVALVSTPADDPNKQTEVACDPHDGVTGHQPKNTVYELVLKEYDPKRKYFVVADLSGQPPNSPPDRQGCEGHAKMRKVKE
jgi:hypothetical protein